MPTPPSQPPDASQPADSQPADSQPADSQPADSQPADRQAADRQAVCPRVGERPLPDPALVRLLAVPDSAPPYDDALTGLQRIDLAVGADHLSAADDISQPGQAAATGGQPGEPQAWPGRFAQVLVETLAGSRPPRQMVPWTTQRARANIQRLAPKLAAGQLAIRQRPHVRRVVTSRPCRDVVEMTVIVGFGPHIRALAVRLEHTAPRAATPGQAARTARWLCTDVEAA